MEVIFDIETNGLDNPDKLWLIVCKDIATGERHVFRNVHEDLKPFQNFAALVSLWVGHNSIGYDQLHCSRLAGVSFDEASVLDTLVLSRLFNAGRAGGHSLESWGEALGYPKVKFNDFSRWSQEMEDYCIQDVEITHKLYQRFSRYLSSPQWKDSIDLEHKIAFICLDMNKNGFYFDISSAKDLHKDILGQLKILDSELQSVFKPRSKLIREITPRATKHGTLHRQDFRWLEDGDLTPFSVGSPFSLVEFEPFNAGSPKQIVERLNEAGWQPYEKTKGHIQAERDKDKEKLAYFATYGWKVSEANLATLPADAPEAPRKLVQRLLLDSRRSTLEEWLKAYDDGSKRIHGSFSHIGAWTHRMSHSAPNMANIPAGESVYAHDMRSMWCVPDDRLLVGVDADGIQLRVLAHYMHDEEFTNGLINGKKEDGTDAHSLNQAALGSVCRSRDDAKTFIYAWLLGAGFAKVANILGCTIGQAKTAVGGFIERYPGLKELKKTIIPKDANRGYFEGLDGRLVLCDSEHLMLAGYLQNGESIIMKRANVLWREKLRQQGIWFRQVNFVHDEWQTEVENDYQLAMHVANVQAESIREVGELLKLRCPMAGSILNTHKKIAIGRNWSETH